MSTKILFVCHGNICRSPMAEFVMKDLVAREGLSESFMIASAATSRDELGNCVYGPAREVLSKHSIGCEGKRARLLTREDYEEWDYIVGMDEENRRNMLRLFDGDPARKVSLLLDYAGGGREVADPWYTRRFDIAYRDIEEGCTALLKALVS